MSITWTCKFFDHLTPAELHALLQLRSAVFVVEQNCVFLDIDNKDQLSWHLMGWVEGKLVAYARLVPSGISFAEPSIGRVVTAPEIRRSGAGKLLMEEAIRQLYNKWNKQPVRIGAQYYLLKFYSSFGFQQASDIYMEDGIEHIEMILNAE